MILTGEARYSATVNTLQARLIRERDDLKANAISETEVRLVRFANLTERVEVGDVCYDTAHGIACAAETVYAEDTAAELRDIACALIEGVEDQLAELEALEEER